MPSSSQKITKLSKKEFFEPADKWFEKQEWTPMPFQKEVWWHYYQGKNGILNAPTGSGKTYALLMPIALEYLASEQEKSKTKSGIRAIWISPIRALTKEIEHSANAMIEGMNLPWTVGVRTGDTSTKERKKQLEEAPDILITTPESLHLLLAQKNHKRFFKHLKAFIADEWHELLGSKRAVQVELALSRMKMLSPGLKVWGISATIGNLEEAAEVLQGSSSNESILVKAKISKKIVVETLLPEEIEKFPWAGHLGIRMLPHILPIIRRSKTTLIFTNTRSQAEIWYQRLLEAEPSLAGYIAMHHGSMDKKVRTWVEEELHGERLKAVVCTSSLDLGVDFRPVESIVQIGGPKGVARFMQRAGRSGHQPGAISRIYFVPTHSLELVEAAALRQAMAEGNLEHRIPYLRSFDVLVQYMVTRAVGDGFYSNELLEEVRSTFAYESITDEEWAWLLNFVTTGGKSLGAYDEYKKVEIEKDGLYKVHSRRIAMRHRLSIGTIVTEPVLQIRLVSGGKVGTIEEYFVSRLNPGDVFWFGGRNLELVRIKGTVVQVRKSNEKRGKVPSWMGARMPLSSQMSAMLRVKLNESLSKKSPDIELQTIFPLVEKQQQLSHVPSRSEFLIEMIETEEGHHVFMFPFEGRFVHEGMASLIAYRISLLQPISFSIALNDYGFELLSDQEIPLQDALDSNIFSPDHLYDDIMASVNATEMARRKFRDVASIAGLVFKGFPGRIKKDRHLQSSSQLFFEVFHDYEPNNLLLRQAFSEVIEFQLEETRMREALSRISNQKIIVTKPDQLTPFSFPLLVDRLSRERLSNESLTDRIKKMQLELERR